MMAILPNRTDVPPRAFMFLEVHTLDFEERCGHQHESFDDARKCAAKWGKQFRRRRPWPGVAIWAISGRREGVIAPRTRRKAK